MMNSSLFLAGLACLSLASCKGEEASAGATSGGDETATAAKAVEPARPLIRASLRPYRPLLAESARAELDADGTLVDLGTADQHKFTRGGWFTGWGENKLEAGVSYAEAKGRKVDMSVWLRGEAPTEVVVRARSKVAGQKFTVFFDDKRVGDGALEAGWTTSRIPVKEGSLTPGRHKFSISFTAKGEPRAEIDWVWLSNEAGAKEPLLVPRVIPVSIDKRPKRSLVAPTARAYSFYLEAPEGGALVVDMGTEVGATFRVRAQTNDGTVHDLYEGVPASGWSEQRIDLDKVAGQAIRLELSTEGKEGVTAWGEPEIMLDPAKASEPELAGTGTAPKNVIVILIDTVRADVYEAFNKDNEVITPTFDAFAKKSTVFLNAHNNENWTKPSVATTLSGVYPTTHDTKKDSSKLPDDVELLSEHLKAEGFATAGFVANGYVSEKFGFEQGWDVFKNYIRLGIPSEAEKVYGDALAWLVEHKEKKADERFFLYIQTIDPHVVYRVGREYTKHYYDGDYTGPLGSTISAEKQIALGKKGAPAADLKWLKALYFGEVTYHDEHMGLFFEELEKMGVPDDTLIVITNDHGEELGDHGKFGHGHSLYQDLLRAPMVMHFPGMFPAGRLVDEVVENVDVSPTIVDALGVKPLADADGLSLLPLLRGKQVSRPYYSVSDFLTNKRALRVGDWKLLVSSGNWLHLYNVADDPGEMVEHKDDSPVALRLCEVHLGEALNNLDKSQRQADITTKRQFKSSQAEIDPELRKQLEALGYFGE